MMNAWICESCGATIKQEEKPNSCSFCNRKLDFTQITIDENKDEASEKYDEALKKLEEYEKDIPKRKISDHICSHNK